MERTGENGLELASKMDLSRQILTGGDLGWGAAIEWRRGGVA